MERPVACAVGFYWPASESRSPSALPLVIDAHLHKTKLYSAQIVASQMAPISGNGQLLLKKNVALSFHTALSVNSKLTINQFRLIKLKYLRLTRAYFVWVIYFLQWLYVRSTFQRDTRVYDYKQHLVMNADWQKFCTENISASGRMQFNEYLSIKPNSLNRFRIYKQFYKCCINSDQNLNSFHWTQVLQGCIFYFDYCIKLNHLKNHNDSVRYHNAILRSQIIFTQHLHIVYEAL